MDEAMAKIISKNYGRLAFKIFIAFLSGVSVYFISIMSNQSTMWASTISIFIGGIILVAQVANDVGNLWVPNWSSMAGTCGVAGR
jgi:hypothetical protein